MSIGKITQMGSGVLSSNPLLTLIHHQVTNSTENHFLTNALLSPAHGDSVDSVVPGTLHPRDVNSTTANGKFYHLGGT